MAALPELAYLLDPHPRRRGDLRRGGAHSTSEREDYLQRLTEAVGGDMTATLGDSRSGAQGAKPSSAES